MPHVRLGISLDEQLVEKMDEARGDVARSKFVARALEQGEIADDVLVRFPQLVGAASVVAIIWQGLFERFEPLDVRGLLHAYFGRMLLDGRRQP